MKRVAATLSASLIYLYNAGSVFALQVTPPQDLGIRGETPVSTIITQALRIIYVVAALLVLFFLIFGAFKWITSGGDKEKIIEARKTIVSALIGLAILALALVIVTVVGAILKINILGNFPILNLEGGSTPI